VDRVKELNNLIPIHKLKSGKKVKTNRYLYDFNKRLEELRELELKKINGFLK
jgi:hypothetical protein